jgi:Tfp pilus assembly protein PilW
MRFLPPHQRLHSSRSGTSLIELILFLAILCIVGFTVTPLLFAATENRLQQQTVSLVEQNGTQILQDIAQRVRASERVLAPSAGATLSLLALQTGSGVTNPTIIGSSTGSLVIVRRTALQVLSSPQITVKNFRVRNTSTSQEAQSVFVSFSVSATLLLQAPRVYERSFSGLFTLPPADQPQGAACGCAAPACVGSNRYEWELCQAGTCFRTGTTLVCP